MTCEIPTTWRYNRIASIDVSICLDTSPTVPSTQRYVDALATISPLDEREVANLAATDTGLVMRLQIATELEHRRSATAMLASITLDDECWTCALRKPKERLER